MSHARRTHTHTDDLASVKSDDISSVEGYSTKSVVGSEAASLNLSDGEDNRYDEEVDRLSDQLGDLGEGNDRSDEDGYIVGGRHTPIPYRDIEEDPPHPQASPARSPQPPRPADPFSNTEIDLEKIKLVEMLGMGLYGKVFKGILHGKEVAVKLLPERCQGMESIENLRYEIELISKMRHPNLVLFMGASTKPGSIAIVTEYLPRGSIADLLSDPSASTASQLPFKRRMSFAKDAVLGLNWLHRSSPPFIHFDLRPSNLLVDEHWTVKVGDLFNVPSTTEGGVVRHLHHPKFLESAAAYTAPEVLLATTLSLAVDVYSFGIILWQLATKEVPYGDKPFADLADVIRRVVDHGERPRLPPMEDERGMPRRLRELIVQCWATDPNRRPTFQSMIDDAVFDRCVVDEAIHDPTGRRLWMTYFLGKDLVAWPAFAKAFCAFFNLPAPGTDGTYSGPMATGVDTGLDRGLRCLRTIVVTEPETDMVKMEEFSKALECFGPLTACNFLTNLVVVCKNPWFHGELDTKTAEERVIVQKPGYFLVRFSSVPGCFTITGKNKQGIAHYRVTHRAGGAFTVGEEAFSTLEEVVKGLRKKLYLKHPCPGSKFQEIFHAVNVQVTDMGFDLPDPKKKGR